MDRKSILFFADRLPPLVGGMEMHARYFIEYFSHHPSFPITGIVTKTTDGEDILISEGHKKIISIEQLTGVCNPAILFFNSGRWIEQLEDLRNLFPSAIFLYRTGGNEILKAPVQLQNIPNHKLRQIYWISSLNNSIDLMITNSKFTEIRLREIGIKCVFSRCIGGVNTNALKKKKFTNGDGSLRMFCAARFVPYKNHKLLLSVFHQLILRGYKISLDLAGEGPLLSEIQKQVEENNLESVVKFLGPIDNEIVCEKIANTDIYIQLSEDYLTKVPGGEYVHAEGMGRSILEALSAGTFVIAGKSGALSEIITKGKGLIINSDNLTNITNKIEKILNKLPRSLPHTENYSWKNLFKRYENLIMELIKNENSSCY